VELPTPGHEQHGSGKLGPAPLSAMPKANTQLYSIVVFHINEVTDITVTGNVK
jgi:hypothetical protein